MPREQSVSSVEEMHSAHTLLNTEFGFPYSSLPGKGRDRPGKKLLRKAVPVALSLSEPGMRVSGELQESMKLALRENAAGTCTGRKENHLL